MKKRTKGEIILSILLIMLALIYVVPFLMMILGSFKSQSEAAMFNLELPKQWLISNYTHVLESGKILLGYVNSAIYYNSCNSVIGTFWLQLPVL